MANHRQWCNALASQIYIIGPPALALATPSPRKSTSSVPLQRPRLANLHHRSPANLHHRRPTTPVAGSNSSNHRPHHPCRRIELLKSSVPPPLSPDRSPAIARNVPIASPRPTKPAPRATLPTCPQPRGPADFPASPVQRCSVVLPISYRF